MWPKLPTAKSLIHIHGHLGSMSSAHQVCSAIDNAVIEQNRRESFKRPCYSSCHYAPRKPVHHVASFQAHSGRHLLLALGTVVFVHFQQQFEKDAMHQGVVRDMEQQRVKKERQLDFDMQRALEEEYRKGQTVKDSVTELEPPKRYQGRYH
ncbi:cytochrome c oxidase assembly protein [Apiospora hydei]|uniref:Cytochrome c oxidase assembly protein n=1 Tax=Apiospora hydei TaxID=1337664 RepID=A0ABR1UU12_9PEZI